MESDAPLFWETRDALAYSLAAKALFICLPIFQSVGQSYERKSKIRALRSHEVRASYFRANVPTAFARSPSLTSLPDGSNAEACIRRQ